MTTQRSKLEKEIAELSHILESKVTLNRQQIAKELRGKLDELSALDNGDHWTQPHSDTLQRIVVNDLLASAKVIK